jgi:hypothetical protein
VEVFAGYRAVTWHGQPQQQSQAPAQQQSPWLHFACLDVPLFADSAPPLCPTLATSPAMPILTPRPGPALRRLPAGARRALWGVIRDEMAGGRTVLLTSHRWTAAAGCCCGSCHAQAPWRCDVCQCPALPACPGQPCLPPACLAPLLILPATSLNPNQSLLLQHGGV